jgi:hypothetical protein
MSVKQPEQIEFEFNVSERERECIYCAYPRSFDSHVVAFAMARVAAMRAAVEAAKNAHERMAPVFSMQERLAQRQQTLDSRLYESILARIKHLPF